MNDDLDEVRTKLAARRGECFDRIDDAISELIAVHGVDADQIHAHVRAAVDREASI